MCWILIVKPSKTIAAIDSDFALIKTLLGMNVRGLFVSKWRLHFPQLSTKSL